MTQSHCCRVVQLRLGYGALVHAGGAVRQRAMQVPPQLSCGYALTPDASFAHSDGSRQAWRPPLLGQSLPSHVTRQAPHVPAIQRCPRRHRQHGCRRVILPAGAPLPWWALHHPSSASARTSSGGPRRCGEMARALPWRHGVPTIDVDRGATDATIVVAAAKRRPLRKFVATVPIVNRRVTGIGKLWLSTPTWLSCHVITGQFY